MMHSVAERLARGESVEFSPVGNSMVPLIHSKDRVRVVPARTDALEVGDIVLVRVAGSIYLHKISAIEPARSRVQISNNRGRVNGWTSLSKVYGICTHVAGVARPAITGKTRTPEPPQRDCADPEALTQ